MTDTEPKTLNTKELALQGMVGNVNRKRFEEQGKKDYNARHLLASWKMLHENGIDVTSIVSEYASKYPATLWGSAVSSDFGVFTKISTYTNKKGVSHASHETMFGVYLGTASNMGDEPVSYKGNFPIIPIAFKVNARNLANATKVEQLFEAIPCDYRAVLAESMKPKTKPVVEDDDDIPLAQLVKRKK